jgi:hypothetical protein
MMMRQLDLFLWEEVVVISLVLLEVKGTALLPFLFGVIHANLGLDFIMGQADGRGLLISLDYGS